MRARSAAQATVRALGRTRLGRPSFPTVSCDQRSKRPVPVLSRRPQLTPGTSLRYKERVARLRAEQRLAPGGRRPPDPEQLQSTQLRRPPDAYQVKSTQLKLV